MAILLQNSAEGQADGTTISSGANTGGASGEVFSASKTATATMEFDTAQKAHGTTSYKFAFTAASESAYLQWVSPPLEAAGTYAIRGYFYMGAAPAANDQFILLVRNAGGTAFILTVEPGGRFRFLNAASGGGINADTVIPANTWVRFSVLASKGTTTSNGSVQLKWYLGDSTTQQGATLESTAYNTGTSDFTTVRFGRGAPLASAWGFWLDDLAVQTAATDHVPPYGANLAPVVTVAPSQTVQVGAPTTITWTANDSDGTIASQSITRSSGPGSAPTLSGSGSSRTVTFTTQGTHVYAITATDDDGAVSATVYHTVYVTDTTARPQTLVTNPGVFTNVGGAASIPAALADESDTTYAESPDNPAGASFTVDFAPLGSGPITIATRDVASSATPAITRLVELLEGSTVRASFSYALTTSAANHNYTLTTPENAAIVDRNALRLRFTDTAA